MAATLTASLERRALLHNQMIEQIEAGIHDAERDGDSIHADRLRRQLARWYAAYGEILDAIRSDN